MPAADSWEQKECFLRGCYAREALSKAGTWEKTFCPSFPPPTHGLAFSAWPLTCTHGSHEHPDPQNGWRSHSLAPQAFSGKAGGQGQKSRMRVSKVTISS